MYEMAILLFIEMGNKLFKNAKSYCKKNILIIDISSFIISAITGQFIFSKI